ncbi:hypothetical protein A6A08_26195 [Nocardiopsis sp. TSRI0078]|uniref:hypothetical protein n=1 Tax=unclassified Nocardiopsis TaxID=2649073 RepID=UPI00093F82A3|nr:hypothetical protein [Nocardiopsis sp. TSRI0078]OKI16076.1 hypothetical protein A6A08_26195 [Nocardiopsis sp. TSRI0078]
MAGIHGRRRRARGARAATGTAAAGAALLLLAACSGGGGGEVELERGESGILPAAEPPAPEEFGTENIEGVSIKVPDGWETQSEGGTLCVSPPGQTACAYGSVQLTPHAAGRHPQEWPAKGEAYKKDDGWAADTGSCRSLNTAASGGIGVEEAKLKVSDFTEHADGLKSHHSVWEVACANDDTFEVRMWFLPISDVLLYVWSADSQYSSVYDEIALSMDTTGYQN